MAGSLPYNRLGPDELAELCDNDKVCQASGGVAHRDVVGIVAARGRHCKGAGGGEGEREKGGRGREDGGFL